MALYSLHCPSHPHSLSPPWLPFKMRLFVPLRIHLDVSIDVFNCEIFSVAFFIQLWWIVEAKGNLET